MDQLSTEGILLIPYSPAVPASLKRGFSSLGDSSGYREGSLHSIELIELDSLNCTLLVESPSDETILVGGKTAAH